MEVIGIAPNGRINADVILRVGYEEINAIVFGREMAGINYRPGDRLNVCARFSQAMDLLNKIEGAKKLASQLRCLADTIEVVHPALERVIPPDETNPDETKPDGDAE